MMQSTRTALRFTGRIDDLNPLDRKSFFDRSIQSDDLVTYNVRKIIESVRARGDDALLEMARTYDGVELVSVEVPRDTIRQSLKQLDPALESALTRAARNIDQVHSAQLPTATRVEVEPGVVVTRRPDPLTRVGIYAPGGTASYMSSVLMCAVPARVAGVKEIVMCSPPQADALPSTELLAAAAIAGVDRVFAIGGAGAIAAMAYGTDTVPRVDRIVGPGNAYVAEAKVQVAPVVGIDCPAGPSELLVIADDSATPDVIAREMLAQAEHDTRAVVICVAVGNEVAEKVAASLDELIDEQVRRDIILESLASRGGILVVDSEDEAIRIANVFAAEHLLIATRNSLRLADESRSAGSVFIGETSSVAFGDYLSGGNHVLPTGGLGRSYSGLSTPDFIRWTTRQSVSVDAARKLASDVSRLAISEGLPAHAAAAESWSDRS
jgi:histidinol dehydrogenase